MEEKIRLFLVIFKTSISKREANTSEVNGDGCGDLRALSLVCKSNVLVQFKVYYKGIKV